MPLQIKALGYVLQPGERFLDSDDLPEDAEIDSVDEGTVKKRSFVYKKDEILEKIKEINPKRNGKQLPWIETLTLTADEPCSKDIDRNQTLKVEQNFKDIALKCVKTGLQQLVKLGIDFNRPSDFYADMLKTDIQMERVMKKLANRTKRIQERKGELSVKVKKGFDKQVKQRQRKNKFIKEVGQIMKNRKGDVSIENQIDDLIDSHSKPESKKKFDGGGGIKQSRKKHLRTVAKGSSKTNKAHKGGKTKQKSSKKSQGKSSHGGKGERRGKGGKKGKGRK